MLRYLAALVILAFGTPASAQLGPYDPLPATPVRIGPAVDLTIPDSPDISSIAFAPGGTSAYVHMRSRALDVGAIVARYWPWWAGVLLAACTLVLLALALRVRRRPQVPGAPHCRRCGYLLDGVLPRDGSPARSESCPECGAGFKERSPLTGRGTGRRLAPLIAVFLLLVGIYAGLWLGGVSRWGGRVLNWTSTGLAARFPVQAYGWLKPYHKTVDRVVEIDPATGAVRRTILQRPGYMWVPLELSPDGESLFLVGEREVSKVRTGNGSTQSRLRLGDGGTLTFDRVLGFSPDGATVYITQVDQDAAKTRVIAWDTVRGTHRAVAEGGAFATAVAGGSRAFGREFRKLGESDPPRFVSFPHFMEAFNGGKPYEATIHEADGSTRTIPWPQAGTPTEPPVATPSGQRVYVINGPFEVDALDLARAERLGALRVGSPPTRGIAADERLLYIAVHGEAILVRDTKTREWAATLTVPTGLIAPPLFLSPDGRWLAAIPFESSNTPTARVRPTAYIHHLLIYDLSKIRGAPD